MAPRTRNWLITLAVLDVVVFLVTLHAHLDFHRTGTGPSVMTLGQALGWFVTAGLLALIMFILTQARRTGPRRR